MSTAPMSEDYVVFFHLLDPAGKPVTQDDTPVLGGQWTTSSMLPGFASGRSSILQLPANLAPGQYTLWLGAYHQVSIERLPAYGQDGQRIANDIIELGAINIR